MLARNVHRIVIASTCVAIAATTASAQWSSDPASNVTIAGGSGAQNVPQIRPALGGGVWVSYFSNAEGTGYKPYVTRMNADGSVALAPVLVGPNRTSTSTSVYDFKVDAAGNALITFDQAGAATIQKVAVDGSLPWGSTGISMPNSSSSANAKICPCVDGTIVVCWSDFTTGDVSLVDFQRIDAAGANVANGFWQVSDTGHAMLMSDLQAGATGGDVIALWLRNSGTSFNGNKGLKIQKFNSTGTQLWGSGAPIDLFLQTTPASTIPGGTFPKIVSDGAGGAVVAWFNGGTNRNAYVQHVFADGTPRFQDNGLEVCTTSYLSEYRLSASVAYFPGTTPAEDAYTVVYQRSNPNQTQFGLAAQRITADGTLNWNFGAGLEIVPFSTVPCSGANIVPTASGKSVITWLQYTANNGPMLLNAVRLDDSGGTIWSPGILTASDASTKGSLVATSLSGSDMIVALWADGAAGSTDIKAQNINIDGTIGLPPPPHCTADIASLGGSPGADHQITVDDLVYFLSQFFAGNAAVADIVGLGGTPGPDAQVSVDDLIAFLTAFFAGCP